MKTQGITYLEALSSGLPVICRKDPCVEGIVKGNENGFQYETYEEFRDEILKIAGTRPGEISCPQERSAQGWNSERGSSGKRYVLYIAAALAGRLLPYEAVYEKGCGVMTVKRL